MNFKAFYDKIVDTIYDNRRNMEDKKFKVYREKKDNIQKIKILEE